MAPRGPLTYSRLVASLSRLREAIAVRFPDAKDAGRAEELRRVMDEALDTAREGVQRTLAGDRVESPVELKREVERRIGSVHERYDGIGECDSYSVKEGAGGGRDASVRGAGDGVRKSVSPESGKENTGPQPAVEKKKKKDKKKVSAVRKTLITKQPSGKKPSASVGGTDAKRTSTRKKNATTTTSVPPTITTTTREEVEEDAAHHAAATALLDLSFSSHDNNSPSTSFTSALALSPLASTTTTTPTREKKRAYEPEAEAEADAGVEAKTTTSRPHKCAKTLHLEPLPTFAQEETARDGFLKGVEYAIAHFKTFKPHPDGDDDFEQLAGLTELMKGELGLNARDGRTQMPGTCYAGDAEDGAATLESGRSLGGYAEKGGRVKTRAFWDVV